MSDNLNVKYAPPTLKSLNQISADAAGCGTGSGNAGCSTGNAATSSCGAGTTGAST